MDDDDYAHPMAGMWGEGVILYLGSGDGELTFYTSLSLGFDYLDMFFSTVNAGHGL